MDVVIRAAIAYIFIVLLTRIAGRRELASLEPFDLVLLIVLGDLIQQGVTQSDYSVFGLLLAGGTIGVLQVATSYLGFRGGKPVKLVLEGEPIVLVEDGNLINANLKRERLDEAEVLEAAREQNIGHLSEIAWAILETSGRLTFIKKSES
jgi:uncharacterized membrane protein YcaP (DUF421 family)